MLVKGAPASENFFTHIQVLFSSAMFMYVMKQFKIIIFDRITPTCFSATKSCRILIYVYDDEAIKYYLNGDIHLMSSFGKKEMNDITVYYCKGLW